MPPPIAPLIKPLLKLPPKIEFVMPPDIPPLKAPDAAPGYIGLHKCIPNSNNEKEIAIGVSTEFENLYKEPLLQIALQTQNQ